MTNSHIIFTGATPPRSCFGFCLSLTNLTKQRMMFFYECLDLFIRIITLVSEIFIYRLHSIFRVTKWKGPGVNDALNCLCKILQYPAICTRFPMNQFFEPFSYLTRFFSNGFANIYATHDISAALTNACIIFPSAGLTKYSGCHCTPKQNGCALSGNSMPSMTPSEAKASTKAPGATLATAW